MERFTPDENPLPHFNIVNAGERITNAVRFILDRIYFDVPHVIETEE